MERAGAQIARQAGLGLEHGRFHPGEREGDRDGKPGRAAANDENGVLLGHEGENSSGPRLRAERSMSIGAAPHIGGLTPLFSTVTAAATSAPSAPLRARI